MRFTTTSSIIYTAASMLILACCVSLKHTNQSDTVKPSFFFQTDTLQCSNKSIDDIRYMGTGEWPSIVNPYINQNTKKDVHNVVENGSIAAISDSIVCFHLYNDSALLFINLFTNKTEIRKYSTNEPLGNITQGVVQRFFYVLGYGHQSIFYADNRGLITKFLPWSNFSYSITSWEKVKSKSNLLSKILELSPNRLIYSVNYYAYIADSLLTPIDSFPINYECFWAADCMHNKIAFGGYPNYEPSNEIYIKNLSTKNTTTLSLPIDIDSNRYFKLNAIKFSQKDSNLIYYCSDRDGIYSYNLLSKVNTLFAESCKERNFQNFILSANEEQIFAETHRNIYLIDSINTKPIIKQLIKQ